MPTVMMLRLKAGRPLEPGTFQLHGLVCALFEGEGSGRPEVLRAEAVPGDTVPNDVVPEVAAKEEPVLEEEVHAEGAHEGEAGRPQVNHLGQRKPFAVWPLQSAPDEPGDGWVLRVSWLATSPLPPALIAPSDLRLGHVNCAVTEMTHRSVTHGHLASGPPLTGATFTFHSPTYFSQNGSDVVLPEPRLILGSWRRQWNAWAPADDALKIDDDAWRNLHRSTRLTEFDLCTQRRDSGRGHERAGFTGTAVLRLGKDASAAARSRFGALARFAEFCGTGAQTTHGFGATTVAASLRAP